MADEIDISERTITVPSIVEFYTDEQLNREYHAKEEYENAITKYGVIYRVVSFSDLTDVDDIKQMCREWIRKNYFDGVLSFSVKAVDLHLLGYNKDKILVGDRIPVEFLDMYDTPVTKVLTCLSAQYDLLKPENSTYKIGIPDVSTNIKYRKSISASLTNQGTKPAGVTEEEVKKTATDEMYKYGLIIDDMST